MNSFSETLGVILNIKVDPASKSIDQERDQLNLMYRVGENSQEGGG